MKQNDKNRLLSILKNYNNISLLLGDLLNPITTIMEKYKCEENEAANIKLNAEDYLKKYGCMTLDATTKAIKNIIGKINTKEESQPNVPQR